MTQGDYNRLASQIGMLRQIAAEYSGKTIDNIIQQMEARAEAYKKSSYKTLLVDYLVTRRDELERTDMRDVRIAVVNNLLRCIERIRSNELVMAKLNIMLDAHRKWLAFDLLIGNKPKKESKYNFAEDEIARECLDYLKLYKQ